MRSPANWWSSSAPSKRISTASIVNYLSRPFDNIKIRQAFALATNKDLLARTVLHGSVIPTNHLLPQGVPGYNASLTGPAGVKSTAGDASKAKQLLQTGMQEEGYSSLSQLPAITLTYPAGDPDLANYTAALQQEQQYNDAEQKLVNDVAWLPLYQAQILALINPKLQHYTLNSLNIIPPDGWGQMYMAQ